MQFRHAREDEASALSSIAFESKACWSYSVAQLAAWKADLTVSSDTISSFPTYVVEVEAEIVGFFVLEPLLPYWKLEHFWVSPKSMGQGVGRALLACARSLAAKAGATAITIDADPNAEQFYLACGALRVGSILAPIEGLPSRERPQLVLSTQ